MKSRRGLVVALLLFGAAGGAQAQDKATLGQEWLEAVRAHRPGTTDEPAARISTWSLRDLERALDYYGTLADEEIDATAVRAATLHADIAMWQWDAQQGIARPPPSGGSASGGTSVVIVIDGRFAGTANVSAHWSFARRLVDRIRPSPDGHAVAHLWYRATVAYLLGNNSFTEGLPHVRRALALFPDDAFFLLASGCASETLGSARIQEAARSIERDPTTRVAVSSAATYLREAEKAFRAAAAMDPSLIEARLRLGRVLALRGESPGAVLHLQAVAAKAADPALRYYAYLFLGERLESLRRIEDARDAYESAARLFPSAQTPLLALGHLARKNGDQGGARAAATRLAALPRRRDTPDDPWWSYDLGPGRGVERMLAELHAALR